MRLGAGGLAVIIFFVNFFKTICLKQQKLKKLFVD
jgi:hypothetical protein